MSFLYKSFLNKFCREGVLHRDDVNNDKVILCKLLKGGFVKKVYYKNKIFYELTVKALPLLESQRKLLLEEVKIMMRLFPRSQVYAALLKDVRFLDEKKKEAQGFRFLGDWQLNRPVVPSQIDLAKYRFYQNLE